MTTDTLTEHPNVTATIAASTALAQGDVGPSAALTTGDVVLVDHDNGGAAVGDAARTAMVIRAARRRASC
jgi:hypothetical protein